MKTPHDRSLRRFRRRGLRGGEPLEPRQMLAVAPFVGVRLVAIGDEATQSSTVFELRRSGSTATPLVVHATLAGTATPGLDYTTSAPLAPNRSFSVTIPAGVATTQVVLPTRADAVYDPTKTIELIIQRATGYTLQPAGERATAIVRAEGVGGVEVEGPNGPALTQWRNERAFAALRSDRSVVAWGAALFGGEAGAVDFNGPRDDLAVVKIVPNQTAFAALRSNGSVVAWGDPTNGGDASGVDFDGPANNLTVTQVFTNASAFAALRSDGTVVTWGSRTGGGDSSGVDFNGPGDNLRVIAVAGSGFAFAALRSDGTVVAWGHADSGGDARGIDFNGPGNDLGVTSIHAGGLGFAAIRTDGTVVAWGGPGADASGVDFNGPGDTLAVATVVPNTNAFAALRTDGSVVTWGNSFYGGDSSAVDFDGPRNDLTVVRIFPLGDAYAAVRSDGSVVTWGYPLPGVAASTVDFNGPNDDLTVTRIISNGFAHAAQRNDGSVVTWGEASLGGDSSRVDFDGPANDQRVVAVVCSNEDFAALRSDGRVVRWGNSFFNGLSPADDVDFDGPNDSLAVTRIFASDVSFAALRSDGSVVTWGEPTQGGNSSAVDFDGPNGGLKVATIATSALDVSTRNGPPTDVLISAAAVPEGRPAGTVVGTLSTIDPDAGDLASFVIVSGNMAAFRVVGDQLRTTRAFDRARKSSYVVGIRATDAAGLFVEKTLTIAVQGRPDVPTNLVARVGDGRVTLAWSAPVTAGNAAATDYVVQYSQDGGTRWTSVIRASSAETSAVVTGLTNGTSYVFRVAAENAFGLGEWSAASAAVTPRTLLPVFAVGAEIGAASVPRVRLLNATTGGVVAEAPVFEPGFRGGIRVSMGDVDGDGVAEVVAASGPGRVAEIRVFRQDPVGGGTVLTELVPYRTLPFGNGYTGGLEVAVGDVDDDGREDLIAAMSRGVGTVNVFRSVTAADPVENVPFRTFTPFGPGFNGGASVAVADVGTFVQGGLVSATVPDNRVEVVVGSGAGIRSTVQVYDLSATPRIVTTIQPFPASQIGGVTVASGRYDDDAIEDLVVSSGRGGRSTMHVFSGLVGQAAPARLATSTAFAALARPNAPLFTAPLDVDGNGSIDRFHASQGDAGGTAGVLHVARGGERVAAVGSLAGPLRIAAPRTTFKTVTTASGLRSFDLFLGTGTAAAVGSTVTTDYRGIYATAASGRANVFDPTDGRTRVGTLVMRQAGEEFDSSARQPTPPSFLLRSPGLISGWVEGIPGMRPQGRRVLVLPSALAYGADGSGTTQTNGDGTKTAITSIPPNAALAFDVKLLNVR